MNILTPFGGATVHPVLCDGQHMVTRSSTPGHYSLWRYDIHRTCWHTVGGIMRTPCATWEAYGDSSDIRDEDGEIIDFEPFAATEDFMTAIDALWTNRQLA